MLFNSLTFVVFFVVIVSLYWSLRGWQLRKNLLVVASYTFYGAWNPPFAALLFSTTAMDFWLGRQIGKAKDRYAKRRWLVASVCMNLSMLGFFKYGNFLLQNFQWLLARAGVIYQPPHLDILLPVGISFYTFHSRGFVFPPVGCWTNCSCRRFSTTASSSTASQNEPISMGTCADDFGII